VCHLSIKSVFSPLLATQRKKPHAPSVKESIKDIGKREGELAAAD